MCKHFDTQTTQICADHITRMLGEYSANPAANWRSKDAAVRLALDDVPRFVCRVTSCCVL
jgi:exportin-2 (importin alpha re-exporter)